MLPDDEKAMYYATTIEGINADKARFNARLSSLPFTRSAKREAARKRRRLAAQQISNLENQGARGQHPSRECETNAHQSTVTVIPRAMENDLIRGVDPWQQTTIMAAG